jgi:hypothetical protein
MSFIYKKENKPELQYNYYNILSKKININQLLFTGKPNNPNLIIRTGSHDTKYTSSKLYLFSKNNSISNKYIDKNSIFGLGVGSGITSDFDAELVVENISITNSKSNNKVLLCFLLKTNAKSNSNIIDAIMESNINTNLEIELNDIIPQNDEYIYHEPNTEFGPKLEDATIIIFKDPITCKAIFENINNESSNPFLLKDNIENMIGQIYKPSVVEGYTIIDASSGELIVNDTKAPEIIKKGLISGNVSKAIIDNIDNAVFVQTPPTIILDNNDYLECSTADIDGKDITTYDIALNQEVPKNFITQFTTAIYFGSLFSVLVVSYFIVPTVYKLILDRFITTSDKTQSARKIVGIEMLFRSIIYCVVFILFIIGILPAKKMSTSNYGYVGYAINILLFLIISIVIIEFKKGTGLILGTTNNFDFKGSDEINAIKTIKDTIYIYSSYATAILPLVGIFYGGFLLFK